MKRLLGVLPIAALLLAYSPSAADAAPIELNSGSLFGQFSVGEGEGRGIGVFMLSGLGLTSIGIQADLDLLSFDVQVYASADGSSAGALLATSSAVLGGAGYQWWDVPLNYALQAGNYYVIHFRPTVDSSDWLDAGGVGLRYFNDDSLPVDVGPFRLINGEEGFSAFNFSNSVHADLRVNGNTTAVPEPVTLMLLGTGLAGLVARRRVSSR